MNRYKILSIILSLWCFTTMAMEKKEEQPNLKEKIGLNIAKDLIKVYDTELSETKSSANAFNKIEQYFANKNLPKDLIEYIYCLISINLNRNDIFLKEIFKNYAKSRNLDLFYNLCPQAQYILIVRLLNTMIHYAQPATEQKHISREIEQLVRDIIKLNSNIIFANKLYLKLLSIYKNLPKVLNVETGILAPTLVMQGTIRSLMRMLEDSLPNYFKNIDINKEILNFEKELTSIAQDINKQARKALEEVQEEDILSQTVAYEDKMFELLQNKNNEEESYIKNIILNYYNKFGSVFIYKAFDKSKEELNKNYDLDHKLIVYFTNQVKEIIKSITKA